MIAMNHVYTIYRICTKCKIYPENTLLYLKSIGRDVLVGNHGTKLGFHCHVCLWSHGLPGCSQLGPFFCGRRTAPFKPSFPEAVVHRVAIPKTVYTHKHYGIHALNYSSYSPLLTKIISRGRLKNTTNLAMKLIFFESGVNLSQKKSNLRSCLVMRSRTSPRCCATRCWPHHLGTPAVINAARSQAWTV